MATDNSSSQSGGVSFIGLLTILFIGLKLGGVIDWSWWLVLSPFLFSAILSLAIVFVAAYIDYHYK